MERVKTNGESQRLKSTMETRAQRVKSIQS